MTRAILGYIWNSRVSLEYEVLFQEKTNKQKVPGMPSNHVKVIDMCYFLQPLLCPFTH